VPVPTAAGSAEAPIKYGNYITMFKYNTNSNSGKDAKKKPHAAEPAEQQRQQQQQRAGKPAQKAEGTGKKQTDQPSAGFAAVAAVGPKEAILSVAPVRPAQQQQQQQQQQKQELVLSSTAGKQQQAPPTPAAVAVAATPAAAPTAADGLDVLINGHLAIENPWAESFSAGTAAGDDPSSGGSSSWSRWGRSVLPLLGRRL
jgi:hypothetical protein